MAQLHRLTTPGALSSHVVLLTSLVVMGGILILALITPADIRLHVLYVFPLAAIALHCEQRAFAVLGFVLSVSFQFLNFAMHGLPPGPLVTDAVIAFSASLLVIGIARAARRNYLEAANLACTDWLTGLHNRRGFEFILDLEITRQDRYGETFSLVMMDLDDFKVLNDTRGHDAGDKALRILAEVLREHTRQSDAIARLGGDEFAILMPSTQEANCLTLCQQLSKLISTQMIAAGFSITASTGFVTFEHPPASTSEALDRADKAMYAAKSRGRGAVNHYVQPSVARKQEPDFIPQLRRLEPMRR